MGARLASSLVAAALLLAASGAVAQDSTAVATPEASGAAADPLARADSLALVAPDAPPTGRVVSPLPATTAALSAADLLAPGALGYRLGTPGRVAGIAWGGLPPERAALLVDGRPLADPFTGAPGWDLLMWEAADRLRAADARGGAPQAVVAQLRPFRLAAPVTELRFHAGEGAVQSVSATHAQTRGAPLGLGGASARLTTTAHVAGRQADGPVLGARQRHSHALLRFALASPRWGAEAGLRYAERREGARRGVVEDANFYDVLRAAVLDPGAERRTLATEATVRARTARGGRPLAAWAAWGRQVSRYSTGGLSSDTASVSGNAWSAGARAGLSAEGPALEARAVVEDDPWGRLDPLGDGNARLHVHAAVVDTLQAAGAALAVHAGGQWVDGRLGPALSLRAERRGLHAVASWTAPVPGRVETAGYSAALVPGVLARAAPEAAERWASGEVGARGAGGPLAWEARALARRVTGGARLAEVRDVTAAAAADTAFAFLRAEGALGMIGARGRLSWREGAEAGLNASASVAATRWAGSGPLAARWAEAEPALRGALRVGVRARRVGTGTARLEAGATLRGWTAFRGLRVHPATGLLALARDGAPRLPARPVLDLDASVAFGTRAVLRVRWDNVLSGLVYPGASLLQGEPLPASQLRFGVFWALTG